MKKTLAAAAIMVACPAIATDTVRYNYDALGRVITSDRRISGGNGARTQYSYDAVSNRSRVSATGPFKPARLTADMALTIGQGVLSADTRYLLLFQPDGNLVLYNKDMVATWASNTHNLGATQVIMQGDGNLVIYNGTTPLWFTGTNGSGGRRLDVQNDGGLVIYTDANTVAWRAVTCCQ